MGEQFAIDVQALASTLDALDYFEILKIPQTATPAEIKAAYYRESRAYHPDRFAAYPDAAFREVVGRVYRRVNEAYTVLRDDTKRTKYAADLNGPERAQKLRFTEADEAQVKEEQKRKLEEQLGQTPNGRKFYAAALADLQAGRLDAALRALRSALMYEPGNVRFNEQLALLEKQLDQGRPKGDAFKIR
jgi:curved DNA-binding protein CbpA